MKRFSRKTIPTASEQAVIQDLPSINSQSAFSTWSSLTPRERAVSELLCKDKSNLEICAILFVSENTVRTHIKNIYQKTGAGSRDELKKLLRETSP